MITEMLTKLFAMNRDAIKVFGSSSSRSIRLAEGCCFVLSRLMSRNESEKNATSEPDTINEMKSRNSSTKTSIVMAVCGAEANRTGLK